MPHLPKKKWKNGKISLKILKWSKFGVIEARFKKLEVYFLAFLLKDIECRVEHFLWDLKILFYCEDITG